LTARNLPASVKNGVLHLMMNLRMVEQSAPMGGEPIRAALQQAAARGGMSHRAGADQWHEQLGHPPRLRELELRASRPPDGPRSARRSRPPARRCGRAQARPAGAQVGDSPDTRAIRVATVDQPQVGVPRTRARARQASPSGSAPRASRRLTTGCCAGKCRRSVRIEDEADGLILVLLSEVSACRHAIPPLASAAVYDRASTRSGTVDSALFRWLVRASYIACPSPDKWQQVVAV
jgi:hypothetical protein